MKKKLKIAFFDFTDCEGCQLQIVNLNTALLDVLEHVDIVNFREAMSNPSDDYAAAVVEGAVSTEHDIARITAIRKQAKVVIALGACATIGGVNAIKNTHSLDTALKRVYGEKHDKFKTIAVKPIDEVIKVDYYIHGCPVYLPEVVEVFKCALFGKKYNMPNYPVCVECKINENVCMYQKEQNCMGPVTRAGCNSWCVNNGNICYGCRGLVDNPAGDAQRDILDKYGLTIREIMDKFTLYSGCYQKKYGKQICKY
ncbi:MAG: cytochrome B [Candidatus Omnitrophica bacterium CG11_big_fil_rev_8_21_14_0_20_42_13]|uniref:Cytochrome B n=1 Tax=Candidatus Ghiorseimicrobium undicola TaxID=1974746 RepID=A0A2H0LVW8_9BACT|nr:MAG: cytochrome B [Candidatus Omnitrophica bacterium CG11_big_fil_rev_8_21_14_0_20_42_13]